MACPGTFVHSPSPQLNTRREVHTHTCEFKSKVLQGLQGLQWEVHPKMITSYLVVFGALSRMVKVRTACDEPFWIYKRLNNCTTPAPDSGDVLVVASLACHTHKNTSSSTTKTSPLSSAGGGAIIQLLIYPKRLIACTSDLHHSTQRPEHYEI